MSAKTPNRPASPDSAPSRPRDLIRVRALQALEALQAQASASGRSVTSAEIDAEIAAVRAERRALVAEAAAAMQRTGALVNIRALEGLSTKELDAIIRSAAGAPDQGDR